MKGTLKQVGAKRIVLSHRVQTFRICLKLSSEEKAAWNQRKGKKRKEKGIKKRKQAIWSIEFQETIQNCDLRLNTRYYNSA